MNALHDGILSCNTDRRNVMNVILCEYFMFFLYYIWVVLFVFDNKKMRSLFLSLVRVRVVLLLILNIRVEGEFDIIRNYEL